MKKSALSVCTVPLIVAVFGLTGCNLPPCKDAAAAPAAENTTIEGLVTEVDEKSGAFSVLVPVPYDPQNARSAELVQVTPQKDAAIYLRELIDKQEIAPGGLALIKLFPEEQKKLESFNEFNAVTVEFESGITLNEDGGVKVLPTEVKPDHSGTVVYKGHTVPFRPTCVYHFPPSSVKDFIPGVSLVKVFGQRSGDKMVGDRIQLTQLPDPRKTDDPKLPRVLIIGDSISWNYHESAKAELAGKFNYHRIYGNSGDTRNGMKNLDIWLGPMKEPWQKWDVVLLNHGLHDLKQACPADSKVFPEKHQVEPDEYAKNLEAILTRLTAHSFKVIVCTTTPVPNDRFGWTGRRKDEDLKYNKVMLEVVKKFPQVQVLDLNKVVRESKEFDEWRKGVDVHYGKKERAILGKAVAEAILKAYNGK